MNHLRSRRSGLVIASALVVAAAVVSQAPRAGAAGPTVRFGVGSNASVVSGFPLTLTVTAVDAAGLRAGDYRGTVRFSSSDPAASLPADYTFTAADNGAHSFPTVILKTPGIQTVTVTDIADSTIKGVSRNISVASATATTLAVGTEPFTTTPDQPIAVTVSARGSGGGFATGYRGTVHFTSTDPAAELPPDYTFTDEDSGTHRFTGVVLKTVGTHTVTATDTADPLLVGVSNPVTVTNPQATALAITGSTAAFVNGLAIFSVSAVDDSGRLAPSYRGTVRFTSTDPQAEVPGDYTFTAGDGGTLSDVVFTFRTAGSQTVTVTDTAVPTIRGVSAPVTVTPNQLPTSSTTVPITTTTTAGGTTTTTSGGSTTTTVGVPTTTPGGSSSSATTAPASAAGTTDTSRTGASGGSGPVSSATGLARTGLPLAAVITLALLFLGFGGAALRERQRRSFRAQEAGTDLPVIGNSEESSES